MKKIVGTLSGILIGALSTNVAFAEQDFIHTSAIDYVKTMYYTDGSKISLPKWRKMVYELKKKTPDFLCTHRAIPQKQNKTNNAHVPKEIFDKLSEISNAVGAPTSKGIIVMSECGSDFVVHASKARIIASEFGEIHKADLQYITEFDGLSQTELDDFFKTNELKPFTIDVDSLNEKIDRLKDKFKQ